MAMVGVDSGSLYRRTHSLSRLAWSCVGGRLASFYIHQMNQVELSQWLCHDYSTINIVLDLIIIYLPIPFMVADSVVFACSLKARVKSSATVHRGIREMTEVVFGS